MGRWFRMCSAVLIGTGCSDPAGPPPFAGIYELSSVNAETAPGAVAATTTDCTIGFRGAVAWLTPVGEGQYSVQIGLSRALRCPGFGGSGFLYEAKHLQGILDSATALLELNEPAAEAGRSLALVHAAQELTLIIPDTLFGLASPATLRFNRAADLPKD